jgi:hypothetical protein
VARPVVVVWREHVRDSEFRPTVKLVAYTISTFMDADGWCRVSRPRIARAASLSEGGAAVWNAVTKLERAGLLRVKRSKGGQHTPNEYQAVVSTRRLQDGLSGFQPVTSRSSTRPLGDAVLEEQESARSAGAPRFSDNCTGCGGQFATSDEDEHRCEDCRP